MTRKRLIIFIAVIQSLLFLIHLFLYETWTFSPAGGETPGAFWIKLGLGILSVSFVAASLLAYRYTNAPLRAFYRAAAVWMGMLTFPLFRRRFFVDYFWRCAIAVAGLELPSHGGITVRCCDSGRTLRRNQCKLDANHAHDGAARESAGDMARQNSGADQ